jgi:CRP-like cAMP-binding protein
MIQQDGAVSWTRNRLLKSLDESDAALLRTHLEPITLARNAVLFDRYQPITHVHFFEGGLSSEIAVSSADHKIEVGCIGLEGFSGVPAVLGVHSSPHYAFMQHGGPALRVETRRLRQVMGESGSLSAVLLKYAHVFMIQIAATALADGRYVVEARLARWLLMCHDRLGDELGLTHDFLALMLGVRRPSVTDALHKLEGERAIKAERGRIFVRNRRRLEELAGDSYGLPEAEYQRLIEGDAVSSAGSRPQ